MTKPIRKPGDPGHVGDICNALHDPVHVESRLHPNPRWGPSRSRMTETNIPTGLAVAYVASAFAISATIGLAVWITESALPLFAFLLMPGVSYGGDESKGSKR